MKKILPISEEHNMVTPLMYGNILSILMTDDRCIPWIYSNYILVEGIEWKGDQDCLYRDGYSIAMDKERIPDFLEIRKHDLENKGSLELIKSCLNQNEYVYLQIDEFYIGECTKGGVEHLLHDLLVFGYDEERQIIFALGVDKNLHYRRMEVPYESIILGMRNRENAKIWNVDFVNGVYEKWASEHPFLSIKYNPDEISFCYDISNLVQSLETYVSEAPLEEKYFTTIPSDSVYMGIRYYDLVIKNTYIKNGYKAFVLINHLCEHKLGMQDKLRYLQEHSNRKNILQLVDDYQKNVVGMGRKVQFHMLKTNAKMIRHAINDEQLHQEEEQIIDWLKQMRRDEFRILTELIACLKKE